MRLAAVLKHAGRVGVPADTLIDVAGFTGGKDASSALAREFRHLRNLGWQIENVGGAGEDGRYVMTTVDNRLRLKLTPAQQAALLRAVVLADRGDLADRLGLEGDARPPEVIASTGGVSETAGEVVTAVRMGRRLRFRYKGTPRVVHPQAVRTQNGTLYLSAREEGSDEVKTYVVSRMSEVEADQPGTAERTPTTRHAGLHPMSWELDPPVDVTLRAGAAYAPDVRRWLGPPAAEATHDDEVEFTYRVTNREALRCRLYELGPRVRVVGPDEVRAEVIDELSFMAGE